MKTYYRYIYNYLCIIVIFVFSCIDKKKPENASYKEPIIIVKNDDPNCVDFVALWSAAEIAEQLGKDKKWVFLNYTVDLWDIPPGEGLGNKVGKLRASSYARIIDKIGDDYKVESPINQVHGWVNQEHVKTISKKNPKTRALCE